MTSNGNRMIYLDNNATTIVPPVVIKETVRWMNKGNPSADYKTAKDCQHLMKQFRDYIASGCNFISYEPGVEYSKEELKKVYHIVFTSGASESNNCMIRSITAAYKFNTGITPHIVTSSVEHKSIIECVNQLASIGAAEVTFVKPDKLGFVNPEKVGKAIKKNTALVTVMHANNETGAINNIRKIGKIAHDHQVPFHTDDVQSFGKYLLDPVKSNVDAFSVSFHKLHGDKGIGLLVVKKQFKEGFHLLPQVCGSQNCGFRGGTENISGIAGSFAATKLSWENRAEKNAKMLALKKEIMKLLQDRIPCQTYREYLEKPNTYPIGIVFLSDSSRLYLPNTLLLSVVKRTKPDMCNGDLKKALEEQGVIVSIGSACNTANTKASHVLDEMGVDMLIRRGTIRVSIGDVNRMEEAQRFVNVFIGVINNMVS